MAEQPNLDALRTYIDGKLKRLNLLFAVNGGAFAIAKLSLESKNGLLIPNEYLAVGAILFTIIMVCDTWLWARMMNATAFMHMASLFGASAFLRLWVF